MSETLQDIKRTVVINAPIDKVWRQVSTSEAIAAWFMPNDFSKQSWGMNSICNHHSARQLVR